MMTWCVVDEEDEGHEEVDGEEEDNNNKSRTINTVEEIKNSLQFTSVSAACM